MKDFIYYIEKLTQPAEIELSVAQLHSMERYYHALVENNKEFNLTSNIEPEEAALHHFFDSITVAQAIPQNSSVLDVGSGAGFPIAPLKIIRPDIDAYALEATEKKCAFIAKAAKEAGIEISVICGRAEAAAREEYRGSFDVCVSRAVASLDMLLELCIPFLKVDGLFLAYKGDYKKELTQAENALLHLHTEWTDTIKMPVHGYNRNVLVFRKKWKQKKNIRATMRASKKIHYKSFY
ncbi:MAG: 16S rRNA (guanine(527)-N(7))-methyltransferase RsmG [Christensenellaceae bacterium]